MDSEYLKLLGINTLPSALLLLAIMLFGKKIIESYFASSIEKYKSELTLLSKKNEHVFSKIHEKKIQAITEVYSKLKLLYKSLVIITSEVKVISTGQSPEEVENELAKEFGDRWNSFVDSFLTNELYLSNISCELIEKIMQDFKIASAQYSSMNFYRKAGVTDTETLKNAFIESRNATKRINDEFPKVLHTLKENFTKELEKFEIERD